MNPSVEAAVFETARGGILREGLGFDRCDVAVVTNIGEGDHLGLGEVNTAEDLAKVKRCIVDVVPPDGTGRAERRRSALRGHGSRIRPARSAISPSTATIPVIVRHRSARRAGDFRPRQHDHRGRRRRRKRSFLSLGPRAA